MISPELLRRYPFFGLLTETQLKALAMISEEESIKSGSVIFSEREPAVRLYFLKDGSIDLTTSSAPEFSTQPPKVFDAGEINPGEIFGISALIEPYVYTATATAAKDCCVIAMNAQVLRGMMELDCLLGYTLMKQVARACLERLTSARVQLAAAWAK